MRSLALYLDVHDTEEEDLAQLEQVRVPGSCEWLVEQDPFIAWRDREGPYGQKSPQVFWLNGDPGKIHHGTT